MAMRPNRTWICKSSYMRAEDPTWPPRPTALAHWLAARALVAGDTAVDATCGNGHDTLMLARLVGPTGSVTAIDIQPAALDHTRHALVTAGMDDGRVRLVNDCHSRLNTFIAAQSASWIMFNLGYLPGGNRAVTSRDVTTLAALDAAIAALMPGGRLAVTCYPGHAEGSLEAQAVEDWMRDSADAGMRVAQYRQPFTRKPAPILWLAAKPPNPHGSMAHVYRLQAWSPSNEQS